MTKPPLIIRYTLRDWIYDMEATPADDLLPGIFPQELAEAMGASAVDFFRGALKTSQDVLVSMELSGKFVQAMHNRAVLDLVEDDDPLEE